MSGIYRWLRVEWDRVTAWLLIAIGVVILVIGFFGVSGTVYPAEQIPYVISGGIGGIFALGLGCMLWLSADLRDEWHKLDRMEAALKSATTGRSFEDAPESGNREEFGIRAGAELPDPVLGPATPGVDGRRASE